MIGDVGSPADQTRQWTPTAMGRTVVSHPLRGEEGHGRRRRSSARSRGLKPTGTESNTAPQARTSACSLIIESGGLRYSPVGLNTWGKGVLIPVSYLKTRPPFDAAETRTEFWQRLSAIPSVSPTHSRRPPPAASNYSSNPAPSRDCSNALSGSPRQLTEPETLADVAMAAGGATATKSTLLTTCRCSSWSELNAVVGPGGPHEVKSVEAPAVTDAG